jgi:broad-specificity NMP kinase
MDVCNKVVYSQKPDDLEIVRSGQKEILFAYPNPCIFVSNLTIGKKATDFKVQETQLGDNYVIKYGKNLEKEIFLPKEVWEPLKKALENFRNNGTIKGGILLYGVPGTGKSEVAKVMAEYLGIGVLEKGVSDMLSRYVGESEQSMKKLFMNEILKEQPVVVFMDEIDWLASKRNFERTESVTKVQNNIMTEFLRLFQDYIISKKTPVLFIGTTNAKLEDLDDAFKRRFPIRVYFASPSREAIRYFLEKSGKTTFDVKGKKMSIDELVNYAIAMGISIAELRSDIENNDFSSINMNNSTNLRRMIPFSPINEEDVFDLSTIKVDYQFSITCDMLDGKRRVILPSFPLISRALVSTWATMICKKQVFDVLPSDNLSVEEIMIGLKQYSPVLLLNFNSNREAYPLIILSERLFYEHGIDTFYVTTDQSFLPDIVTTTVPTLDITNVSITDEKVKTQIVKTVMRFYGINGDPKDLMYQINGSMKKSDDINTFYRVLQHFIMLNSEIGIKSIVEEEKKKKFAWA